MEHPVNCDDKKNVMEKIKMWLTGLPNHIISKNQN